MAAIPFRDREDAAHQLVPALARYRSESPLVLAIPRGGVPIGRIVADALGADLDVVLVRKIGAPSNPEYAIGAVDEQGSVFLNNVPEWARADTGYVRKAALRHMALIRERRQRYCSERGAIPVSGRTVIVVDDGLATGATMIAALHALRARQPARLVVAVPVASDESLSDVRRYADDVVCLATPRPFRAVGLYYRDFSPVEDDDVSTALGTTPGAAVTSERTLHIAVDGLQLSGDLIVPKFPFGIVLFAHGSGSGRLSPRNRYVARELQQRGIATLLVDLLTPGEDGDTATRFDIALLTHRLQAVLQHVQKERELGHLPIGLFGASTGAAAAISVAADNPGEISALVSRGGRPDLALPQALSRINVPTLLIVGGADTQVLALNRNAQGKMEPWAELVVIPGATHLFEEAGALAQVVEYASFWFLRNFRDDMQTATAQGLAWR